MWDLIIRNIMIIDGTNRPPYSGAIGVKDGHITDIWDSSSSAHIDAREVIDGNGRYLAPGFIDIHSHSDTSILDVPLAESRLFQGITTEIAGNCGISAAPISKNPHLGELISGYTAMKDTSWNTFEEYLNTLETHKISTNVGLFAGHGNLRINAMGFDNRKPTPKEMEQMKAELRDCLTAGAFGYSSGLIYPPGSYADTEELIELAEVLKEYPGTLYATHMRDEGLKVREALAEAIQIAETADVPLEVSHHKVARKEGWQNYCFDTIRMMNESRERGNRIYCDQYPYTASSTGLDSNIPMWAFEGGIPKMLKRLQNPSMKSQIKKEMAESHKGRWQDIYLANADTADNQKFIGKNIASIAKELGTDPEEACIYLVISEDAHCNEVNYGMCEEDIEYILKQPYTSIGSDGNALSFEYKGQPHPRHYGTFVRVLAHYSRDRHVIPIETAIYKMTGLSADKLGLTDRGFIKEGMWADLVLFDLDKLQDHPSYEHPVQPCSGIDYVWVNGVLTIKEGLHTGAKAGMALRKK